MNERQAIEFELHELKEQSRKDFDMYFELRKHRNQRYSELQNRLREIDERDMNISKAQQIAESAYNNPFYSLPKPKANGMSVIDLRVDKYNEEPVKKKRRSAATVNYNEIINVIKEALRENNHTKLKPIKNKLETTFNKKWANYNSVMRLAMEYDNTIKAKKIGKDNIYFLEEEVNND
jgi:hypothetical protein